MTSLKAMSSFGENHASPKIPARAFTRLWWTDKLRIKVTFYEYKYRHYNSASKTPVRRH